MRRVRPEVKRCASDRPRVRGICIAGLLSAGTGVQNYWTRVHTRDRCAELSTRTGFCGVRGELGSPRIPPYFCCSDRSLFTSSTRCLPTGRPNYGIVATAWFESELSLLLESI